MPGQRRRHDFAPKSITEVPSDQQTTFFGLAWWGDKFLKLFRNIFFVLPSMRTQFWKCIFEKQFPGVVSRPLSTKALRGWFCPTTTCRLKSATRMFTKSASHRIKILSKYGVDTHLGPDQIGQKTSAICWRRLNIFGWFPSWWWLINHLLMFVLSYKKQITTTLGCQVFWLSISGKGKNRNWTKIHLLPIYEAFIRLIKY